MRIQATSDSSPFQDGVMMEMSNETGWIFWMQKFVLEPITFDCMDVSMKSNALM